MCVQPGCSALCSCRVPSGTGCTRVSVSLLVTALVLRWACRELALEAGSCRAGAVGMIRESFTLALKPLLPAGSFPTESATQCVFVEPQPGARAGRVKFKYKAVR